MKLRENWNARGRHKERIANLGWRHILAYGLHRGAASSRGAQPQGIDEFVAHREPASFLTQHRRPKQMMARPALVLESLPSTAILVQGPVVSASDFTLETLRWYRLAFPETHVIYSTWDSLTQEVRQRVSDLGVDLVLSARPQDPGPANINLQVVSVGEGLVRARTIGAQFVLRTRADQRMYSPSALSLLHSMYRQFPAGGSLAPNIGRIVTLSLDTFRYRIYGLSDQFHFGHLSDLERMWLHNAEAGLDGRSDCPPTQPAWEVHEIPEVALTSTYLKAISWELTWTLDDWWAALRDAFLVLDASSVDLLWPKYSTSEFRWRRYGDPSPLEELTFSDWAIVQAGGRLSCSPPVQLGEDPGS